MTNTKPKGAEVIHRELLETLRAELNDSYKVEAEYNLESIGGLSKNPDARPDIVIHDEKTDLYVLVEIKGSPDTDLPLATAPVMTRIREAYKALDPILVLVSVSHIPPLLLEKLQKDDIWVVEFKDTTEVVSTLLHIVQTSTKTAVAGISESPEIEDEGVADSRSKLRRASSGRANVGYKRVEGSIEVEAPVQEVYGYWKTLENLPQFMTNVEEVRSTGPNTTHWRVKGPLGASLEFDARTTQDEENEAIGWNAIEGDIGTSGQVRFREVDPHRTRLEVQMNYANPPGGLVGKVASRVVANPQFMVQQDLQNFKEIIEGKATPEEIHQRPAAATAQSSLVAFLTSGTGLLVVGGGLVLWLLLRRRGDTPRHAVASSVRRPRITLEFESNEPC